MTHPVPPGSDRSSPDVSELALVLPIGVAAVDDEGRQVFVNAAFAAMVGWDIEELVGASAPFCYWPVEEVDAITGAFRATMAGEAPPGGFRLRFARRDGTRFPALVSVAPLERSEGPLWVAAVTDLSGQSAVERALAERDRRLDLAMEAGRLGSWEYDLVGGTVIWSPGLERIHGLPEGSFGGTFEDYQRDIHPEDLARVLETVGKSVAGEAPHELEYRIVRPDGQVRWLSARGELFRDESGAPARMIGICSDVTERREAEQAVREARDEAEHANRTKAEFLAVMSHDLRTPLNAISGYLDLLEDGIYGPVSERQREAFARMRRNQKQLLSLINDLLHFAQLDAGRLTLEMADWPVSEVLEEMGPIIEPLAAGRRVAYTCTPPEPTLSLRGDLERVRQILLNLLTNAVKFTPPGGRVDLFAETHGEWALLRVRDTGPGIEPERLDTIFDPFVQIERVSDSPDGGGVGLGLAISRELARAMGGDVTVESRPGSGSVFTVSLPRAG